MPIIYVPISPFCLQCSSVKSYKSILSLRRPVAFFKLKMATTEASQAATTLLLLQPLGGTRPDMLGNDSGARQAFNEALRLVARQLNYLSQLFGWKQNEGGENDGAGELLIWVISR